MMKAKVLKKISNYGKKIMVLLGVAAFMLPIFMAEPQIAEAHVLDDNVRPIGRFASVLASDRVIGVP